MKNIYDVAVVVCTYNPVWKKLRATLKSIIEQQDVYFQIVVSDDGSKNNLFEAVKLFFQEVGFKDFKLIANKKNEATVINYYNGVVASDAEYIKCISPGDLFFERSTLSKWLNFTKENNAELTFCDAVFYNMKNRAVNIIRHVHRPGNMDIYLKPSSYHDKVINYVILGDKISGATILVRKDMQLYYLKLMLHRVVYVEDFFIRLAVLDNRKISYFPHIGIWYEFADGGISTSGDLVWKQRMKKDHLEMNEICKENWNGKDKWIEKWFSEYYFMNKKIVINQWDRFIRFVRHPRWLYFRLYRFFFAMQSPINVDERFLKDCFN